MMRPSKPWLRQCSARSSTDDRGPTWHTDTTTILTSAAELMCRQAVKFFWGVGSVPESRCSGGIVSGHADFALETT